MCKRQAPLAAACCLVPVGSSMAPPSPWAGWGRCASPLLWLGLFWVFMMIIGVLRNSEFSSRNPTIFAGHYPTSILSFKVGIHVFGKLEPPRLDLMPLGNWTLWRKPSVAPSLGEGLSSLRSCQTGTCQVPTAVAADSEHVPGGAETGNTSPIDWKTPDVYLGNLQI